MSKSLDWEVQKYGRLINQADTWEESHNLITQKIYYYEGKHYIEVWNNDIRLLFHEMIGG